MSEVVDIVVRESGSQDAATNIRKVAASSAEGQARLEAYAQSLNGSSQKMGELAKASNATESAIKSNTSNVTANTAAHKAHAAEMDHGAEVANHLKEALVGLGLALGVHEWVELTDAYQMNVNGLKQVTSSQANLVATQRALKEISADTFSDLQSNTDLYVKLTKAGKDLNLTQTDMLTVVRVLNDGLRLSGNTTQDAGRAIQQLSVAMMTGEGSSRALLSIMRQMPDLTQAIATKFYSGRDSVGQFKTAVEGGTISMNQVMKAIVSLSSNTQDLRDKMDASTAGARAHSSALATDAEKAMIASGRMFDLSKVTGEANKNVIDLSHTSDMAVKSFVDLSGGASHASSSVSHATEEFKKIAPAAHAATDAISHGTADANRQLTAFEKNVAKVEPTVMQAWQNMKNALFSYVGEADQASGASEKVAQVLELVAHNGQMFFGVLTVITTFLGAYVAAAGIAYAATVLFVTSFSRINLVISIVAAAVVAVYTFGQQMKLTADGSINALGAMLGVLNIVYQGIQKVWQFAQQAPGYWGPAVLAITGLIVAMRLLLGINLITWLVQAGAAMIQFGVATLVAAGPWGLLAAAIVAAGLAWAYYNGMLDAGITAIKEKLTPAILTLTDKMKEFSVETQKTGTAAKEFGTTWTGEIARVTSGFDDSLIPAIKSTTSNLDTLKNSAVTDMGQTAASVNSVTSALSQMAQTASAAGAATSSISGPSGGGGGGGGGGSPPTAGMFTTWHLATKDDIHDALVRSSSISMGDGGKGINADLLTTMIDTIQRNPFDSKNTAETQSALAGLSGTAKQYLKTRITQFALPGNFANGGGFQVGGTGGTDSQLVQFMASPDETVEVKTPAQQSRFGVGGGGRQVTVQMIVQTQDADSFRRTGRQIVTQLESQLARVAQRS